MNNTHPIASSQPLEPANDPLYAQFREEHPNADECFFEAWLELRVDRVLAGDA
jgi:hypothetical protein